MFFLVGMADFGAFNGMNSCEFINLSAHVWSCREQNKKSLFFFVPFWFKFLRNREICRYVAVLHTIEPLCKYSDSFVIQCYSPLTTLSLDTEHSDSSEDPSPPLTFKATRHRKKTMNGGGKIHVDVSPKVKGFWSWKTLLILEQQSWSWLE